MNLTKETFIDEIYIHMNKICKQNKVNLPPRDEETIIRINKTLTKNWNDITELVLSRTKKYIYLEWKKDQKNFLFIHKGFHTSFRYALEKAIPRSLDQIREEMPWISLNTQERLEILNKNHRRVFKEEMTFQKGTVEFLENYACYIPNSEFNFRANSGMDKCKNLKIVEIERWNYISASLYEYLISEKIDVQSIAKNKETREVSTIKSQVNISKMNPMEAIDFMTEKN